MEGTISLIPNSNEIIANEGSGEVGVEIIRTDGSDGTVTVDYITRDNGANAGEDYTLVSGTATFADGETSKIIPIPILEDGLAEGSEGFNVTIDRVTGGAFLGAPRTAFITIEDNDFLPDALVYNGNQYLFTSPDLTWAEAQAEAENLGGNLVTISDRAEENWLRENFSASELLWTGFNDAETEDQFQWSSGQAITYTNWTPGEPNDVDGAQDFAVMNFGPGGAWDDVSGTTQLQGIIELGGPNADPEPIEPPPGPTKNTLAIGLIQPTALDFTPDGSTIFIAEKGGVIRSYNLADGQLNPTPAIDLSAQVNNIQDRGLIDIAIHPDFFNGSPYLYAAYTYDPPQVNVNTGLAGPDGGGNRVGRLSRFTVNSDLTVDPTSEFVLVGNGINNQGYDEDIWNYFNAFVDSTNDFDEPPARGIVEKLPSFLASDSLSHSVGSVEFGPDGALYFSMGDGTSFNQLDPRTFRVQELDNLSGKIVRIDPITGAGLPGNPFYDGDPNSNQSKIYQYGFRNNFRYNVDPQTGRIYAGDVGWGTWEEVNVGPPGANFGWPYYEGGSGINLPTIGYSSRPEAEAFFASGGDATAPILALNHGTDGINAIVMGDILRGNTVPAEYRGDVFFNDLGQGIVRHISFDADGNISDVEVFDEDSTFVVQMVQGPDGDLYYVDLDDGLVGRWEFEDPEDPELDIPINRFQNSNLPGTYLFAGEPESQNIRANFPNFTEEGQAFKVADEPEDDLIQINRFQNSDLPGTYLYAGEPESQNIRANFPKFIEEGIAFYVYGVGAGEETSFFRFQNSLVPGTYIYATGDEANNIRANFPHFVEEGIAFEAKV